jgi:hypothetical protein
MAIRQKRDSEEERMVRSLDALAEYEEFCEALLPKIRRWVLAGWSGDKIRRECASLIQAQMVSKALCGDLRAMKDVLDRHEGMPVKRQEVQHQYAKMSKTELAALALQKLTEAGLIEKK